ncbi:chemotaxis protein CheW [Clostridiaceae bacterium UIB06]|uniref:Chemotaxis protein CheW n=1 Tax=Clostridium thailandense TaxID=2794346 RepID=A0A949TU45_9CLOT|nr:chemotaxis protein CheW [Clostridium thailandense]MBV7272423.1 chemotaxis protein CheW [Clostridium thailandense]MCH5136947.1 chemotaxis protein CheW [Clostridiaceae bacterium UIB06]
MEKAKIEENYIEVLEFGVNTSECNEKYAVEIPYLVEVHSVKSVTKLPCTPAFIIGIINFRGKIISVIDIRNFLGFTTKLVEVDKVKKVIVVKVNDLELGIIADSILACNLISLSEIQKNVLAAMNFNSKYFKGITRAGSIVLDIKNIMLDEKIIVDEEVI